MSKYSELPESRKNQFLALLKTYRLNPSELEHIYQLLKKDLNHDDLHPVEWSVFSALWSEHCSYKSSKIHLRKFAKTLNHKVLSPEGENAGVLDLGQDEHIVFKMESHNHPSFIEPYQGAATGVGGILRDIFTMGARPIASANFLCFGDDFAKNQKRMMILVDGVVRGIAGYGNAVGVPTVTGQTNFHKGYQDNILVNAMSVGLLRKGEPLALSGAQGIGNLVVYVGAKTGRDGIHGASMASEAFGADNSAKKPNVQIGDPYFEKLLIESCLEVLKQNLVVSIQDMGAAGLTSSSFEMAAKGKVGFKLDLKKVPVRDSLIKPEEILLSESQERMLLVCEPKNFKALQQVFLDGGLDAVPIGEVTTGPDIEIFWGAERLANLNPQLVVEEAPKYERAFSKLDGFVAAELEATLEPKKAMSANGFEDWLVSQITSVHHSARTAIYRQFDQRVGLRTARGANYDVAVLRLPDSGRGLAITVGCRPWIMSEAPAFGGYDTVAYQALQMSVKGFKPVGLTDCLNYGNPENPKIMSEFVSNVESIADMSLALKAPVISGNVSFYNETLGRSIPSTPAVGMVGLRDSLEAIPEDRFLFLKQKAYLVKHDFDQNKLQDFTHWLEVLQSLTQSGKTLIQASQAVGRGGLGLTLLKMTRRGFGFCGSSVFISKKGFTSLLKESFYGAVLVVSEKQSQEFETLVSQKKLSLDFLGQVESEFYEWPGLCKIKISEVLAQDATALRGTLESLA